MNTVTDRLIAILEAAGATHSFVVGEGKAPEDGGWQGPAGMSAFQSYVILFPGSGTTDGSLCDADMIIDRDYQVTIFSNTSNGAEIAAKNVAEALSGQLFTTATRYTTKPVKIDRYGPVDRDDAVDLPSLFLVHHIFSVETAPLS